MLINFHNFLLTVLLFSSFMLIFVNNPVHSVLFLIVAFCSASVISILFHIEFVGLLFIIIYVGALAILFLFVVMMLNVKTYSMWSSTTIAFVLTAFFLVGTRIYFFVSTIFKTEFIMDAPLVFDNLSNTVIFGQMLYNYYLICFLLAGILLLVAMVGSIAITLQPKSDKRVQLASRQLARSNTFTAFFK